MKTELVKIENLNSAKYNPRKTLESKSKQYEGLKKSLSKFGTVVPVIVNKKTNTVVGGHQRINVLKELGFKEVEAVIVDLDETEEKQLNIALNKIEGRWDYQKLDELLGSMSDKELEFTGFIDDNIDSEKKAPAQVEAKKEQNESEFNIYISFPTTDVANTWLEKHKIEYEFKKGEQSTVIRMEAL